MSALPSGELNYGTGKKTYSFYIIGMVLCIILTLIPFMVVIYGKFTDAVILPVIFSAAILQFIVQVIFFLRLHVKDEPGKMNVLVFLFSLFILAVILGGSIWIMWSLRYFMSH